MRSKFLFIFLITILSGNLVISQTSEERKRQIEKYKKEMEKKQTEAITDFVNSLEVDDFAREIISQKLFSYSVKKQRIYKQRLKPVERQEKIDRLDETHFQDLTDLIPPSEMMKIKDFVTMSQDERKRRAKEKKKRQRRKNKI